MRWLAAVVVLGLALGSCDEPVEAAGGGPRLFDLEGRAHAPLDVAAGEVNVLVFTTVDCPIANSYAPELQAIEAEFGEVARFYHVHVDAGLDAAAAREHARAYGYPDDAVFLLDREHGLVERLGATITPEVFVLERGGRVLYRGRIDDQFGEVGHKRPRPTRHELRDTLAEVRDGRAVTVASTDAVGCLIE